MTDQPPSPMFSDTPESELVQRRGVSILAMLALLVSCAAALAILGPMLWPVPLAGVALAALALARISAADPQPLGRSMAIVALFMSLLFAAAAPSHYFFRQSRVQQQAELIADEWFTLLSRQQYAAALELSVPPRERLSLDSELDKRYAADEQRQQRLEEFIDNNSLARELTILLQRGGEAKLYDVESHATAGGIDRLSLVYQITYEEDRAARSKLVRLNITRENAAQGARGLWQIISWESIAGSESMEP